MRPALSRLRLAFVMLAWLAQAIFPMAHAVAMNGAHAKAATQAWCGDPGAAAEAMALLPVEIRTALADTGDAADHLVHCQLLCVAGTTPSLSSTGSTPLLAVRAAGLEAARPAFPHPATRSQSPTPPAHAPPAHG